MLYNTAMIKGSFKSTLTIGVGISIVLLAGCQKSNDSAMKGSQKDAASAQTATNGSTDKPTIFATTNVWGSVAEAVGGDKVNVMVAVDDLSQDPHDYQATANDKLNVSKSAMVLVNGGGYDDWGTSLAQSVANKPVIINAVEISGLQPADHNEHAHDSETQQVKQQEDEHGEHHHSHGDFNEHVFFSLDTAKKVAQAVENQLSNTDPANKATYAQNTKNFIQQLDQLKLKANQVGHNKQTTAFATEPVVGYLLSDMGIKDITPKAYVEQSETEAGVSVKALNDSKNILSSKQAAMLIVNAQTEDNTAKQLITLANSSQVPVISVYETFPQGVTTYPQFIEKTIDDFANAVK